jgi:dTDP-glucose pyrophosphorylase
MITNLSSISLEPSATIDEVMRAIDDSRRQIVLIVDDGILIGTVTDGDVRRGILNGLRLNSSVLKVMNNRPIVSSAGASTLSVQQQMRQHSVAQIPLVDTEGRLIALAVRDELPDVEKRRTQVVLMAGGLGMRLRPLTETLPKPMLPINGKPVLENIIKCFQNQGFNNFTLSINYLGDIIRDHFGDGSDIGANIEYIDENQRMGTSGALSLMAKRPKSSFVVMNGDIITTTAFGALMDFHNNSKSVITMCAREFTMQVPYGVLNTDGSRLVSMEEKPLTKHLVNAGIYVLSPLIFEYLKDREALDMPSLIERVKNAGHKVSIYSINEYWLDIGRIEDLNRARSEFARIFSD